MYTKVKLGTRIGTHMYTIMDKALMICKAERFCVWNVWHGQRQKKVSIDGHSVSGIPDVS